MLAVTLTARETLQIIDAKEKTPATNEVLIRVKAAGIGGTDLRIYKGIISAKLPLVLGQEFAGVIEKVGSGVSNFSVGDRVAIEPIIRDNTCEQCRRGLYALCGNLKVLGIHLDGGYSELATVPEYSLHKIPDNVTFEEGALVVPAAVAAYAVSRAEATYNSSFLVVGAGPIGLSALQIARLSGASSVLLAEPLESRRRLARRLGASVIDDSTPKGIALAVSEATNGKGVDIVIEATGNPEVVDVALSSAKAACKVIFAGAFGSPAQVNMTNIVRKDLTVKGAWLYPNKYNETLRLVSESKINLRDYISHRFKLNEATKAFEAAQEPSTTKVVLQN
jgi:2-desacetyl-2-hydroxyethyl bacteriochlorophyllide A dehydrogenase